MAAAQDGAVTSGACVSLFPAQERAWEHPQGSMGGRAGMRMSPNCIWSPGQFSWEPCAPPKLSLTLLTDPPHTPAVQRQAGLECDLSSDD